MEPELEIHEMPIDELVPYAHNAKMHPKKQVDEIANSIKEFGNCDPIAVWHNEHGQPEIVEGHGRLLALKRLGIEVAPVIYLDHLTDEQRRVYTHVHNQTTLSSGFDFETLTEDMDNLNADWEALGFSDYLPSFEHDEVDEEDMPEDITCRCKPGDVWQCGRHRVMCGSSTEEEDMRNLCGGLADMIVTDPPYNVALGQHMRPSEAKQLRRRADGLVIDNDDMDECDFVEFLASAFKNMMANLRGGGAWYVWHADVTRGSFLRACERSEMEVREVLVWAKSQFSLGRQDYQWQHEPCLYGWKGGAAHWFAPTRRESTVVDERPDVRRMDKEELVRLCERLLDQGEQTTVLRFEKPSASELHPTMKPIKLMARLIENSSRSGEVVLDPFGGSGTTLMACEKLGRTCWTMELDPHYCDVIIQRWENLTGKEAVRVD